MNRSLLLSLLALSLLFVLPACDVDLDVEVEGDEPGECSDQTDNDQDGLSDCDDDGCAADGACAGDDDDTSGDDDTDDDDDDDDSAGDDDDSKGDDAGDDDNRDAGHTYTVDDVYATWDTEEMQLAAMTLTGIQTTFDSSFMFIEWQGGTGPDNNDLSDDSPLCLPVSIQVNADGTGTLSAVPDSPHNPPAEDNILILASWTFAMASPDTGTVEVDWDDELVSNEEGDVEIDDPQVFDISRAAETRSIDTAVCTQ